MSSSEVVSSEVVSAPVVGAAGAAVKKAPAKEAAKPKPKVPKGTRDSDPIQMAIRERAFGIIKGVFTRHGAVGIDTPVFELKEILAGKYGEDSKLIYDLQDQGGELCSLRYDLTVPFARYIATYGIDNIKRYHIARVYRRDNPAIQRGRYREFYQCDFDIAGKYPPMAPDADVMKVLTEILDSLPIGPYKVKFNHRKLLDSSMAIAGVPEDKFRTICSAIDKLDKEPWEAVKKEMIAKGLEEQVADKLGVLVQIKGKPMEVLARLKSEAGFPENTLACEAFADIDLLFSFLSAFGCLERIEFDMSLARGLDYYTGVIYEAVLTSPTQVGSIAAGGRYDNLVGMFSTKQVPAVGVSIGIERILTILEQVEKEGGKLRKNNTSVYVASTGPNLLLSRMKVCAALWNAGVATEFSYDDNPNNKKQLSYALDNAVPYMVWVGAAENERGVYKLKDLNRKTEVEIPHADIATAVKACLAADAQVAAATAATNQLTL